MPKAHRDDLPMLQAQYPFALVVEGLGQQVVLTPWRELRHFGQMLKDETGMRHLLAHACRDEAVLASLRQLSIDAGPTLGGVNRLENGKIVDAIAKAVADGQIYALVAEPPDLQAPVAAGGIGYGAVIEKFKGGAGPYTGGPDFEFFEFLAEELPDLWCRQYDSMPGSGRDILQVNDHGYVFLFDLGPNPSKATGLPDGGCDRVIAAFGVSRYNPADRDARRMADFLGKVESKSKLKKIAQQAPSKEVGQKQQEKARMSWRERFFQTYGHMYDRGHFMSHRQGGGLDINLFPQRADINQGRGKLGELYRKMEKACVAEQVFVFSRPIYDDDSWVPARLEYGVFWHRNSWSAQVFPNK